MTDDNAPDPSKPAADPPVPGPPRSKLRRRLLIAGGAALAGGTGVAALAAVHVMRGGTSTDPLATLRDHRVKLPSTAPRMVIARGPSPADNVKAALERMGGIGAFIGRDDIVVIKPNIGWDRSPAQAANTDPEVVAALARACVQAGAKEVIVTDLPCNEPEACFRRSGIGDAARQAGALVVLPRDARRWGIVIPGKPGVWTTIDPYVRATKIINVPVAKHHGSPTLTAGLKNSFGLIENDRMLFHAALAESIVALSSLMLPTLTVIDATRVLLRNGPKGGNLADVKRLDTIAMSVDPVAVDAWSASLLGFDPAKIEHVQLAQQRGLGTADYKSLSPVELQT